MDMETFEVKVRHLLGRVEGPLAFSGTVMGAVAGIVDRLELDAETKVRMVKVVLKVFEELVSERSGEHEVAVAHGLQ